MGKCEPLGTFGSRFTETFDFAPRLPSQRLESLPFSVYVLWLQISLCICVLKTNTDAELSGNSYFASPVVYNFGVIQWAWKGKRVANVLHVLQWECETKRNAKPFVSFDAGYEKTEDTSEKTSLADQEDARLIYLNQPQFTKFCSNRVR